MLRKYALPTNVDVAYFCMEYAIDSSFPIYSGGLGVLAGDTVLESKHVDQQFLFLGLRYATAYSQKLNQEGHQIEDNVALSAQQLDLTPIQDEEGTPLIVEIPIQDRKVLAQAWLKTIDKTPLVLLDTNLTENTPSDRSITDQLYSGDKEHRLLQEMVLGIGGMKVLQALEISPSKYHMNEGHAAFLIFECIAQLMKSHHLTFEEAHQAAKAYLVFTNHTLIPAGNDSFSVDMIRAYFDTYARESNLSIHTLLDLGRIPESSLFSMTVCALRGAGKSNAVSHYHAEKAKEIWPQYPLLPITNGIYLRRWISPEKALVWPLQSPSQPSLESWWSAHQVNKQHLINYVEKETGKNIAPDTLILTWARRFVDYKRPKALFWQLEWLANILENSPVPVHILFAGKVHPHDEQGKSYIADVVSIAQLKQFSPYISFLQNYNLDVATVLTQGSDVWLNTPMEGYEACGTSGMKAALNGVLQCTTNDGWVREVGWKDIGWILDNEKISESLYQTIEQDIIPLYAQLDGNGLPHQWIERMLTSSKIIREGYSTQRMLEEYTGKLYR